MRGNIWFYFSNSKYRYELQKKKRGQQKKSAGDCLICFSFLLFLLLIWAFKYCEKLTRVCSWLLANRMDLKELKMG